MSGLVGKVNLVQRALWPKSSLPLTPSLFLLILKTETTHQKPWQILFISSI